MTAKQATQRARYVGGIQFAGVFGRVCSETLSWYSAAGRGGCMVGERAMHFRYQLQLIGRQDCEEIVRTAMDDVEHMEVSSILLFFICYSCMQRH